MSLYNLINGFNLSTLFVLPMLGKNPDEYPRFRDCFTGELKNSEENDMYGTPKKVASDDAVISVYTRVGGNNREDYSEEIDVLRKMPQYIRDYDDDFDSTFATFLFSIPEKWKADYDKIRAGLIHEISEDYLLEIKRVFPLLEKHINNIFSDTKTN